MGGETRAGFDSPTALTVSSATGRATIAPTTTTFDRDQMLGRSVRVIALLLPTALASQAPAPRPIPDGVVLEFVHFADLFGNRLVAAFDSIPAARYDYRPTAVQQSIGYIAQHLEAANYGLCEQLGVLKHVRTSKDSLADTVKARWPKDTLVARLALSLSFCDSVMVRMKTLDSAPVAGNLLAFETDLAEHYSQLSNYMRLLGLVPPSAIPPRKRTAIELPTSVISQYVGRYELLAGLSLEVTLRDGALFIKSNLGGSPARLWPENSVDFFLNEVDAQVTFTRDAASAVDGLVLHQNGRDRLARRVR